MEYLLRDQMKTFFDKWGDSVNIVPDTSLIASDSSPLDTEEDIFVSYDEMDDSIDAVIIANPKTDLYNPNIIRSSVGCVFTNQIATGTTDEIIKFLKENNINSYCAALKDDSEEYHLQDYTNATAIVVGTEATGLSDEWLANSTKNIIIPMQGEIDSMNVSVAAGILIFEAKRQRDFC